jgi:hypothetical protein
MKRGLVLEGAGAKGAYQFGCLLASAFQRIRPYMRRAHLERSVLEPGDEVSSGEQRTR